jgi:hypothetical protein
MMLSGYLQGLRAAQLPESPFPLREPVTAGSPRSQARAQILRHDDGKGKGVDGRGPLRRRSRGHDTRSVILLSKVSGMKRSLVLDGAVERSALSTPHQACPKSPRRCGCGVAAFEFTRHVG